MSRYTCHNCKSEHGTDNMVAYCAACYSDGRSEFASLREVNIQIAQDSVNLRSQLAAEKERVEATGREIVHQEHSVYWYGTRFATLRDWARGLGDELWTQFNSIVANGSKDVGTPDLHAQNYNRMKYELEAAEAALAKERGHTEHWKGAAKLHSEYATKWHGQVAALTEKVAGLEKERNSLIAAVGEHITVRSEYQERVAGLTAALEATKRDLNLFRQHTDRCSPSACDPECQGRGLVLVMDNIQRSLKDTAPILAAHDAAKQKELVEALNNAEEVLDKGCSCYGYECHCDSGLVSEARGIISAILAKYPKEGV